MLGEVETLGADVAALQRGESQTLRIGVFQTATTELLPGALRTLREQRPDVEVRLMEIQDSTRAFDRLANGELDLAFQVNPIPDDRIQSIPLLDDPWVILTRRDSELAAAAEPTFDLLDGVDLVAWNRRWRTQQKLEQAWRRRGIRPRIVFRTDDNLALQRLVAAGLRPRLPGSPRGVRGRRALADLAGPQGDTHPPPDRALPPPPSRRQRGGGDPHGRRPLAVRGIAGNGLDRNERVCDNAARARGPAMTETALTAAPAATDALAVRACVLREPGRPPAVESVWLDAPGPGEVLVRIAAAGVCHSDVHLADGAARRGPLADRARA